LKHSKCLLCNDSGAMHLANILGTPIFAIFGPTSPEKTGPVFKSPVKIFRTEGMGSKTENHETLKTELKNFLTEL